MGWGWGVGWWLWIGGGWYPFKGYVLKLIPLKSGIQRGWVFCDESVPEPKKTQKDWYDCLYSE